MKKKSMNSPKLALKKISMFVLDSSIQMYIKAGDDAAVDAPRNTHLCIPPRNAPPYFYPNTRNECVVG